MAAQPRQHVVEPDREGIEEDLRTLRRQPGVLRQERMLGLQYLTEYLGDGSEQTAYESLLELRRHHGRIAQSDVHAFFYTSGYKVGGTTLDARLRRYADEFGVVDKTARRRSDRGATKLSYLIRDGALLPRPWGHVIVTQSGDNGYPGIGINTVEGQSFRRPHVFLNGTRLEGLKFELNPARYGGDKGLLDAYEKLDPVPLDLSGEPDDPLLTLEVLWPLPVRPTWQLAAHLADTRLYAFLETRPSSAVEIRLRWFTSLRDADPDRPLAD